MEGFGQTETTLLIANRVGMEPKPGSMGKPMPHYDVDIVDEDGRPVPPGVTGEIVVHTEPKVPFGLFKGYYRDEKKTARRGMTDSIIPATPLGKTRTAITGMSAEPTML